MDRSRSDLWISVENVEMRIVRHDPIGITSHGGVDELVIIKIE